MGQRTERAAFRECTKLCVNLSYPAYARKKQESSLTCTQSYVSQGQTLRWHQPACLSLPQAWISPARQMGEAAVEGVFSPDALTPRDVLGLGLTWVGKHFCITYNSLRQQTLAELYIKGSAESRLWGTAVEAIKPKTRILGCYFKNTIGMAPAFLS